MNREPLVMIVIRFKFIFFLEWKLSHFHVYVSMFSLLSWKIVTKAQPWPHRRRFLLRPGKVSDFVTALLYLFWCLPILQSSGCLNLSGGRNPGARLPAASRGRNPGAGIPGLESRDWNPGAGILELESRNWKEETVHSQLLIAESGVPMKTSSLCFLKVFSFAWGLFVSL